MIVGLIKDISVFIDAQVDQRHLIEASAQVATGFGAQVTGVYPLAPVCRRLDSVFAKAGSQGDVLQLFVQGIEEHAHAMEDHFKRVMDNAKVAHRWLYVEDFPADSVPVSFHYADIGMLQQPEPGRFDGRRGLTNTILLNSGRPILMTPHTGHENFQGHHIMVCWDGSAIASRAVHDSLPLLQRASQVDVVSIDQPQKDKTLLSTAVPLAAHLARCGVKASVTSLESTTLSAAELLVEHAAAQNVDLLVAGAWGHSRASEYLLGGVTRTLLRKMPVPVIFSH